MIRRLIKWLLLLALLSMALVVLLFIFKDSIARVVLENRIRKLTGMEAQIGKFSSGRTNFSTFVTIQNLKLYNTAAFGGTPFLDVPELHLEIDPVALAERKLHFTVARLNLAELDIVRNELGQTNISFLASNVPTQSAKSGGTTIKIQDFEFVGVDVLSLSLGKAKFVDLKNAKNNREIRVELQDQIFKNVHQQADLLGIGMILYLRSGGALSFGPTNLGGSK